MKRINSILIMFLFFYQFSFCVKIFSQNRDDPYVSNEYLIQEYKEKNYRSDWKLKFSTNEDLTNFKKLREYLQQKKDILQKLQTELYSYQYNSNNLRVIDNYITRYEKRIASAKGNELILVDIYVTDPPLNYYASYTPADIKNYILPELKNAKETAAIQDSTINVQRTKLNNNIELIKTDIANCESQIDNALAPEYHQQTFRTEISITFAVLIGILLVAFFWLIHKKSDHNITAEMLSGNGLQFITLFVLIISITLFGILNILEGRELSAILAGISGYILGRGVNKTKDDDTEKAIK